MVRASVPDFRRSPKLVLVSTLFLWLGLTLLAIAAFVEALGPLRWVPIGALALMGGFIAFANWTVVWATVRHGRSPSMVPLIGGPLLLLATLATPSASIHKWAPLALFVDPFLAAQILGLALPVCRKR